MNTSSNFLFSYLNLPQVPVELEKLCLKNIELIDNDKRLNELNKLEGIAHNITYVPEIVKIWILKNILEPNFNPIPSSMLEKTMLHVSHYIKHHQLGSGIHPGHYDHGRNFAINYIINPGGDNVTTFWLDDSKNLKFEIKIKPRQWHIIKVKPDVHGAKGIKIGQLRSIISICYTPEDMKIFDPYKYFEKLLIQ